MIDVVGVLVAAASHRAFRLRFEGWCRSMMNLGIVLMANIHETEPAPLAEEFKQGDILQFIDRDDGSSYPRWGVIINADCDLAHCKIDGVVSYLPIYTFEDCFIRCWIPTYLDDRRAELAQQLCTLCDLPLYKSDELVEWLREEDFASVLGKCLNLFQLRRSQVEPKLRELSMIASAGDLNLDVLTLLPGLNPV